VLFKVTPEAAESVLEDLTTSADGGNGAVLDKSGNVYAEIYSGGKNGEGSVMKLTEDTDPVQRCDLRARIEQGECRLR
jgi:hypothetical protein